MKQIYLCLMLLIVRYSNLEFTEKVFILKVLSVEVFTTVNEINQCCSNGFIQ